MKTLTPEQKAATQARRDQFAALCKQFADFSDEDRAKFSVTLGAIANVEGHKLSPRNTWMIRQQKSSGSIVGTFNQWIKAGRCVMKGEKGVMIAVPVGKKDEAGHTTKVEFFTHAMVFDIAQTKELEAKSPALATA